ncbi:MAG: hypothetical protein U0Q16_14075 [Bryobacteraceae bacterium]
MNLNVTVLALLTIAGTCLADCPDGVRKATPAEAAFKAKVQQAMVDLFPAAPEGFKRPEIKAPAADPSFDMCRGQAQGDFPITMSVTYERTTRVRERDTPEYAAKEAIDAKLLALKKLSPDAQASYDAAKKEYDAVYAPYRAAAKANNKEEAARLRKDVDASYAKMQKVEEEYRRSMLPKATELSNERDKINAQMADKYYKPVKVVISVNGSDKLQGKGWMLGSVTRPAVRVQKVVYGFDGPDAQVEKFMPLVDQARLKGFAALQ